MSIFGVGLCFVLHSVLNSVTYATSVLELELLKLQLHLLPSNCSFLLLNSNPIVDEELDNYLSASQV